MSLAGIFYYDQIPSLGQLENPIHVSRLPVEVNRHDRRNHPASAAGNRPSGKLIAIAPRFQEFAKLFRIHVVGALVDVDKLRLRTSLGDGFGGSDESVRHGEYAIPRANPCGHKGETQRICPTA